VKFTYVHMIYLEWTHPLHCSLSSPLSPSYNNFTGFIVLFPYMDTKYIQHICLPSPSPFPPPSQCLHPSVTGAVLPSCLSFFMYMLIVQGSCALVFHTCIYHTLIILNPYITNSFSIALFLHCSTSYGTLAHTIFT
jgi:hypothetical protein